MGIFYLNSRWLQYGIQSRIMKAVGLICLLLAGFNGLAQERSISGRIVSGEDNEPLPGVTIVVKGTTTGTITDIDGNYKIDANQGDILSVSFVGFQTQEVTVGVQSTINVSLELDLKTLEEVVVVGYGTQKKSDLTGAVASITGDALRGTVTASVDQALQGRVAGVQVTQNSGQPGGAVSIRIRGTTSLTGSSEPLYVIDGIQLGGDAGSIVGFDWAGGAGGQQGAATNPLAFLNPNDIERIEVLKDASATAIYGARAANGVVIITTKRGKKGQGGISYNGYYGIQEVYKTFDLMNLQQYAAYNNEVTQEVSTLTPNANFADPSLLGEGTDWQAAVYRVAPMQSHTISFTGGNENTQYLLSGGYFEQNGTIIGSTFNRLNIRLNIDSKVNDWFTVGTSMSFARKDEKMIVGDGGDGVVSQAAQMAPHIPVKNFDGSFAGPDQQNVSAQVGSNPVALAKLRNNTALNNRFTNNLYGEIQVIKGLKFRTEFATDFGITTNDAFLPTYEWGRIINPVSQLAVANTQNTSWLWKNFATYNNKFGGHELTFLAGTEAQRSDYQGVTAYKINLPNDLPVINQGEVSNIPNTGYSGWDSRFSLFSRVNYNYEDRYLFTATLRRDGSSKFGPENRFGWFPSASVAWRISNESFMPQSSVLSGLKLRLGWGQIGNSQIDNYRFGSSLTALNTAFGPGVRNSAYSNPEVQWESTTMTNIGLDVELFSGRVDFSAEVYSKVTNDLLLQVNLPATFGDQVAGPSANVGSMENKGIELSLSTVNVDAGKFRWSSSGNLSVNRNKVTDIGGVEFFQNLYWYSGFQTASTTQAGYPVAQFYGYVMEGIFTSKEEILAHAVQIPADGDPSVNKIERTTGVWLGDVKWKDLNGDGRITSEDQTIIGDPNPDFTFGFNNTVSYGALALDVYLIGSIGGDIMNYSRTRNEQMLSNFDNPSVTVNDRARTQLIEGGTDFNNIDHVELVNPDTDMPRFDNGAENYNHYMSTRWIEDGTYVRIQNVKLTYTLPRVITDRIKVSGLQVYSNIQNLATFTDYTGLDPQIGSFNQDPLRVNFDLGRYPTPRVYTFGVNVNF